MEKVYGLPSTLNAESTHQLCPGCGHGIAMSLFMQTLVKLGVADRSVIAWPIGCGYMGSIVSTVNSASSAHGRAPAIATGIKRCSKDSFVVAYQGDGDLAAIGTAETIHTANRGENITVLFVNNSIYGMTGGQMAPTTLLGQTTTTSPAGREPGEHGNPIRMAEIIATLEAPRFVARYSLHDAKHVMQAKKGIEKAFEINKQGGYAFVEMLSTCPTGWKMSVEQSMKYVEEETMEVFPLGVFKDVS